CFAIPFARNADSALLVVDIIRSVVERKLVVNLVTAKSVDQLG
ncbi:unnamed protein product, partial [Brassica oleracea]